MAIDSDDDKMGDNRLGDGTFLDRWARRKADVRETELRQTELLETEAEIDTAAETLQVSLSDDPDNALETEPDGLELTEQDVENLDKDSDFSVFMKAAVPAEIRRLALKKLWASDPAYNLVDGLVEYGEDYSQLHINVGPIKSAYQVGKGYVSDDKEDEDEKDPEAADQQTVAATEPDQSAEDGEAENGENPDEGGDEDQELEEMSEAEIEPEDRTDQESAT